MMNKYCGCVVLFVTVQLCKLSFFLGDPLPTGLCLHLNIRYFVFL